MTFSLASPSDHKTPDVWKTWWASFVYPHFKGVEGDLGMFQGQFSKQYPFLNRKGNVWTNENDSKTPRLYKKYQTTLTTLPIRENFECPFVVLQIILVTLSLAISFLSDGFYQRTMGGQFLLIKGILRVNVPRRLNCVHNFSIYLNN